MCKLSKNVEYQCVDFCSEKQDIDSQKKDFILRSITIHLSHFCPTATHCFPYVKKRIAVMYQHHTDLSPIEVAIDEMSKKVAEIKHLCSSSEVDMIRLQLKLQGSISVQVPALNSLNTGSTPHKCNLMTCLLMAPMLFLR